MLSSDQDCKWNNAMGVPNQIVDVLTALVERSRVGDSVLTMKLANRLSRTGNGRCESRLSSDIGHQRVSLSNISRWKSSSMRRTFQVSSGALRFSRLLSPFT